MSSPPPPSLKLADTVSATGTMNARVLRDIRARREVSIPLLSHCFSYAYNFIRRYATKKSSGAHTSSSRAMKHSLSKRAIKHSCNSTISVNTRDLRLLKIGVRRLGGGGELSVNLDCVGCVLFYGLALWMYWLIWCGR